RSEPSAEVVRLAPLTRAGVHALLETELGEGPDAEFVEACLKVTRGLPFLVRELANGLRDARVAPAAASAPEVERIGARPLGGSIALRLRRLNEPARRLAHAVAILECGDLNQGAQLANLEPSEAAEAAEVLAAAAILEPGRPLTFAHPIVRAGVYD